MLRSLAELIYPSLREPQQCESCKKDFHCGASLKGCWCQQISISAETRRDMRRRYKECLCADCLTVLAGEQPLEPH